MRICSASSGLLSEGPRWDAERAELLWVDILAGELHTATVGDGGRLESVRTVPVGRHVGAVAPAETGGYVLAGAGGFCHVDDDGELTESGQPEGRRDDVRMNDGICDPRGRFSAGMTAHAETPGAGRLYRLDFDAPGALSAGTTERRCSSPPPATASTRPPWPPSHRPGTCCASTGRASAGRRAPPIEER